MRLCQLCQREVSETTRHHLIPRTLHSNKWFKKRFSRQQMNETIDLCRDCHRQIHRLIPEKEMGRHFFTLEQLQAREDVQKFIQWLTKKR